MKKAAPKFANALTWLQSPPKVRLTPHSMKLLQTGAFYLFGRDKFYKPTYVMDCEVMAMLVKEDPACITVDVFLDLFSFLWEYVNRAMFLPGQIVQWNTIVNMGNLGALAIPREVVIAFGKFCQNHCLYHLKKAYYIRVSWGQNALYNAIKWMIHPDTIEKMLVTKMAAPP